MEEVDPSIFLMIGRQLVGLNDDDFEDKKKDKDETILEKELQSILQMIQTLEDKNKQIQNYIKKSSNIFFMYKKNMKKQKIEEEKYKYNLLTIEKLKMDQLSIEKLKIDQLSIENLEKKKQLRK